MSWAHSRVSIPIIQERKGKRKLGTTRKKTMKPQARTKVVQRELKCESIDASCSRQISCRSFIVTCAPVTSCGVRLEVHHGACIVRYSDTYSGPSPSRACVDFKREPGIYSKTECRRCSHPASSPTHQVHHREVQPGLSHNSSIRKQSSSTYRP